MERALVLVGVVAVLMVASCHRSAEPVGPTPTAQSTVVPSTPAADVHSPAHKIEPCSTPLSIVVGTENMTNGRGDLCGAFNRSLDRLAVRSAFPAQGVTLAIILSKLTTSPQTTCHLQILVDVQSGSTQRISGGATAGTDHAGRDCIDATLDDLISRQLVPLMQKLAASPAQAAGAVTATSSSSSFPYQRP
ncbi:MAG TPA: hypothetical protein VGM90_33495 [Kofleriaceae bacterium]|jgi:hypothetical protein